MCAPLLASCGQTGAATQATATSPAAASAEAFGKAVNLRSSDLPNLTKTAPGGVVTPNAKERLFARCLRSVNPSLRSATAISPTFEELHGYVYIELSSEVVIYPTSKLARRAWYAGYADYQPKATACYSQAAGLPRIKKGKNGYVFHNARPVVTAIADPIGGHSPFAGGRATVAVVEYHRQGKTERRVRSYNLYRDNLGLLDRDAIILLYVNTSAHVPPPATERAALTTLLSRAEASAALL